MHTKTPWEYEVYEDGECIIYSNTVEICLMNDINAKDNAELIIKAVNDYDELRENLELAMYVLENCGCPSNNLDNNQKKLRRKVLRGIKQVLSR